MTVETIKAEIADLNAKAAAHRTRHNEGRDGYNPYTAKIEDACARLYEAEIADCMTRWDELRAAWNAALAKYSRGGRVDMRDLPKIEAEAGITNSMRMAVKARMEA